MRKSDRTRARKRRRWLMRPGVFERLSSLFVGLLALVLWPGVAVSLDAGGLVVLSLAWPMVAGVVLSGFRRRGAFVHRQRLELHTFVGCTSVGLGDIVRLHVAPEASGLGVECASVTYVFSDRSRDSPLRDSAKMGEATKLAQDLGVPIVRYNDGASFIRALPKRREAGLSFAGIGRVVSWPEFWVTAAVAVLVTGVVLVAR